MDVKKNLARASLGRLDRPRDRLGRRRDSSAVGVHDTVTGVDRDHHGLAAVTRRDGGDERRVREGRRVERHPIGARFDDANRILHGSHTSTNRERDLQHVGDLRDD